MNYVLCVNAQIGGQSTFQFLNLANSARTTALGSSQIATIDSDINLGLQSPSLLNPSMHKSIAINQRFHLAGISHGFSAFGYHLEKIGVTTMVGVTYLNYGDFIQTDEAGNDIGNFSGRENALTLGASKSLNDRVSIGVNLKWVNSSLYNYGSNGIGLDIGFTYQNPEKQTVTTFLAKNVGLQFTSFDTDREAFPLDIQIGTSRRLKYLPLRLSVTLHDLQGWSIRSDGLEDNSPVFLDQPQKETGAFANAFNNFMHHVIIGGEFLIGQNDVIRLRLAYNHQLKDELRVSTFRSLNGFSFGFGFKIKKIAFDYGYGSYHLVGGANHISLSTNLVEWGKK